MEVKVVCREAAALARHVATAVREDYRRTFDEFACRLDAVLPNLLATDFPSRNKQHWLAERLKREYGDGCYLVVNLSGRSYDTFELHGPVMDVVMSGCVPPLEVLLRLCVSVRKWLAASPGHVLVAHGANASLGGIAANSGPVVVLFSCYLSWDGRVTNPQEGFLQACSALGVPEEALWPSQRRYAGYFGLSQRELVHTAEPVPMLLSRIVLVEIGGDGQHRQVEVWQQDQLLFRSYVCDPEIPGAVLHVRVNCQGDMSVRVLRAREGKLEVDRPAPCAMEYMVLELQACFHTAFVQDGFLRFAAHELDIVDARELGKGSSIDLLFEEPTASLAQDPHGGAAIAYLAATAAVGPTSTAHPSGELTSRAVGARANLAHPGLCDQTTEDAVSPEASRAVAAATAAATAPTAARTGRPVFLADDIDAFFDDL